MNRKYFLSSLVFAFYALSFSHAYAKIDYCKLSDQTHEVHLFGEAYTTKSDRSQMLRGLDKISKEFGMGDEVRFIVHKNGANKLQKMCVPGCPDEGLLGNLLSSECSAQVAKKDMILFKKKYISSVKAALSASGEEYDIFNHFKVLQSYYNGRENDDVSKFVFHTLAPHGFDPANADSLDEIFVKTIQSGKQKSISLPRLRVVNPNQTSEIQKFWKDLSLDGNKDGFKLDITKVILD